VVEALTSTLPKRTQNLLLLVNLLMLLIIMADLFYLTGIFKLEDNKLFTLVNLLVMGAGLWSFRVKRDLRARLARRRSQPEEPKTEEKD
jgi:hypothetical protein